MSGCLGVRSGVVRFVTVTSAALLGAALARPAAAADCAGLAGALIGQGTVTAAQLIPAGSYVAADGNTYANLPEFCRVAATLTPTPQSDIRIEIWMPAAKGAWNGRFVGTGNGGFAGTIVYAELAATLPQRFEVINTDMGTSPSTTVDGKPITGERQKQVDFGTRSTHLMTTAGKALVEAYYGRAADYSYFTGCSTGGGQALHEAEQFPDDYDGIVGGAPANNRTHVHVNALWEYAVTHATPQSVMPEALLQTATALMLKSCAVASGSLASDGFLTDPRTCHWDARQALCKAGQTANCLNIDQATALNLYYDGPRDPRTGALIFPGPNRGSESGALFDLAAQEGLVFGQTEPTFDGLFYWVFGLGWDWHSFDYDHDVTRVDAVLGPILNANSTDLSAFRAHGGRLLMYHGWSDALVPTQDDIDYFLRLSAPQGGESAATALAQTQQYFRLFLAPGMGHCLGGPGPNVFGGADNPGGPADASHNVLLALQRWVEEGQAPSRIIATKYPGDDQTKPASMTRPLCVFPKVPRYRGMGDSNEAGSFACVDDLVTDNPTAPPRYLK